MQVVGEIVQTGLTLYYYQFPVASAHTNLIGLVELPVQMVVQLLLVGIAQECRRDADAVETVARQGTVGVTLAEVFHT